MASGEIKVKFSEYRPCIVGGRRALFHRWADQAHVAPPSVLRGGHPGGQIWRTVGVVEYEDGTVHEAYPHEIRFLPGIFEDYDWTEPTREEGGPDAG